MTTWLWSLFNILHCCRWILAQVCIKKIGLMSSIKATDSSRSGEMSYMNRYKPLTSWAGDQGQCPGGVLRAKLNACLIFQTLILTLKQGSVCQWGCWRGVRRPPPPPLQKGISRNKKFRRVKIELNGKPPTAGARAHIDPINYAQRLIGLLKILRWL